jgi:YebC/PmpR family DNA-binding regulatory protein
MSGHNKWSGIKHKKSILDLKKGKIFTKVIREIIIAIKEGGDNIEHNHRLRKAIELAKSVNMPYNNIEKTIQRCKKECSNDNYCNAVYEGHGPLGSALIIEAITSNKNKTTSDIKKIFINNDCNLGEIGSAIWMFNKRVCIDIIWSIQNDENILDIIDNEPYCIDDLKYCLINNKKICKIIVFPEKSDILKEKIFKKKIQIISEINIMIPKSYVYLNYKNKEQMFNLLNELYKYNDIKNIYKNFEFKME